MTEPCQSQENKKRTHENEAYLSWSPRFPCSFYTIIKHLFTFSLCSPLWNPTVNFFFLIQYSGVGYLRFRLYDQCWIFLIKSTIFIWAPKVLNCFFVILRNVMFFIFAHNLLVNAEGRFSRQSLFDNVRKKNVKSVKFVNETQVYEW